MTTIVPTAVAACAARGEGGSPTGASLHSHAKQLAESKCKLTLQWMSSAQPMHNFHGDSFPLPPVRRTQKPNPNRLQNPLLKNSGKKAKNARKHCTQIDTLQT